MFAKLLQYTSIPKYIRIPYVITKCLHLAKIIKYLRYYALANIFHPNLCAALFGFFCNAK